MSKKRPHLTEINKDKAHQAHAGLAKIRKDKERMRIYPGFQERTLYSAVKQAGLEVKEVEYEIDGLWFDVATEVAGTFALIDMVSHRNQHEREIEQRKEEVCRSKEIPLLQLERGARLNEKSARVWVWAAKLATSASKRDQ